MSAVLDALRAVMAGGTLPRAGAFSAIEEALTDDVPPVQMAGLLAAMATRGETSEELAGVVDALVAHARRPPAPEALARTAVDVCGTGGDGLGTFNVSTAAAFVVAGAGVRVAKHGNRAVSSSCGSADVLSALGVDIEMTPEKAAAALAGGITFLFAPLYHPAMKKLAPLRKELGIRTVFNLAGPLSNPLRLTRQIVGVDRPHRVVLIAEALATRGLERGFVFSNEAGGDELLPFGRTRLAEVRGGAVTLREVTASDFGLPEGDPEHLGGGSPERNAEILTRVLEGERGTIRDTVVMNAAAALVAAGRCGAFKDGAVLAGLSIDSGAARSALSGLVAASRAAA